MSFAQQEVAARQLWRELMEQIEQEHACYRMFGWLVDDTFPDCFHLFDPNAQPDEGRKEF